MLLPPRPGTATTRPDVPDPGTAHPPLDPVGDTAGSALDALRRRWSTQAGEGVISTGIVVLIMALIGAAMWVAFSGTAKEATDRVDDEVQNIGSDG